MCLSFRKELRNYDGGAKPSPSLSAKHRSAFMLDTSAHAAGYACKTGCYYLSIGRGQWLAADDPLVVSVKTFRILDLLACVRCTRMLLISAVAVAMLSLPQRPLQKAGEVTALAFARDGKLLIGGNDGHVRVVDTKSKRQIGVLSTPGAYIVGNDGSVNNIRDINVDPTGRLIAVSRPQGTYSDAKKVSIFDYAKRKVIGQFRALEPGAFSNDGSRYFAQDRIPGSAGWRLRSYDLDAPGSTLIYQVNDGLKNAANIAFGWRPQGFVETAGKKLLAFDPSNAIAFDLQNSAVPQTLRIAGVPLSRAVEYRQQWLYDADKDLVFMVRDNGSLESWSPTTFEKPTVLLNLVDLPLEGDKDRERPFTGSHLLKLNKNDALLIWDSRRDTLPRNDFWAIDLINRSAKKIVGISLPKNSLILTAALQGSILAIGGYGQRGWFQVYDVNTWTLLCSGSIGHSEESRQASTQFNRE